MRVSYKTDCELRDHETVHTGHDTLTERATPSEDDQKAITCIDGLGRCGIYLGRVAGTAGWTRVIHYCTIR